MRNTVIQSKSAGRGVLCILAISVIGALSPATAQTTYPAAVENYCKEDYFRYCSPYSLGTEELRRCMEAKGMTLSRNCQQALKDAGYVKPHHLRKGS